MSKYNPNIHNRRSIRLKGYDYSQPGLYFVTICVQHRKCLFGEISKGQLKLNNAGKMVHAEWEKLPLRFPNIRLHEFVVMPNHFHAILEIVRATLVVAPNDFDAPNDSNAKIDDNDGANDERDSDSLEINSITGDTEKSGQSGQPRGFAPTVNTGNTGNVVGKTLGDMLGAFQSITTVEYIRGVKQKNWPSFDGKLWQRNYWEHIIRNEQSYNRISKYIINNPVNWDDDKFNAINK